jgi:hypothetical protein
MRDMGFGGDLNEAIINGMEKAEDEIFPQLFRQAVKEALDNVLVNHSDYCLLNRGIYEQKEDGEYIVFPFLNNYPYGCKIMIGPFTGEADAKILFQLYVPRYVHTANELFAPVSETGSGNQSVRRNRVSDAFSPVDKTGWGNIMSLIVNYREMPLSVSIPLKDSCLIELEQEDCYNGYIPSFSFDDRNSSAPFRRNYAEVAFALGQRAKYIFLHAFVVPYPMLLHEYIADLQKIDSSSIYPYYPWRLTESGDIVPK